MPSLIRLLTVLIILAGLGFGGIWALANLIQPQTREITITIPADKIGK
jgi:phage shock protein PspC (stress-responsive transcriptional regulator)